MGDEFRMWLSRCLEEAGANWEPGVCWNCLFLSRHQMSFIVQGLLGAEGSSIVESGRGLEFYPFSFSITSLSDSEASWRNPGVLWNPV